MRVTILGCGTSGGVPVVIHGWGACDPADPRNRRRRASAFVEYDRSSVLIDAGADLREQVLDADIRHLTGVLITHHHADHCHGVDDLRFLAFASDPPVPLFSNQITLDVLKQRFGYLFTEEEAVSEVYQPFLRGNAVTPGRPFELGGRAILPVELDHRTAVATGYRIGDFAYCLDVWDMSEASLTALEGTKVWVVDCVGERPHPTHAHLDRVLDWVERLKPDLTILSSLSIRIDYASFSKRLPPGVILAHDGLVVELDDRTGAVTIV